jgi:hypothetical protein
VIELSRDAAAGAGARRATIALSAGFGCGPLISGLLSQYAPGPTVLSFAIHVAVLGGMLVLVRRAPDTGGTGRRAAADSPGRPLFRIELDRAGWRRFARAVAPMAPFVFGFPAIVLAVLPGMLGGSLGGSPMAYTGVLSALTLAAGVLVQPFTRRFPPEAAARFGLIAGAIGIALGAFAVSSQMSVVLLVVAPILGAAYGVCMTAGLQMVQRLARPDARGGITGLYYVLTYIGFAMPYLLALATRITTPAVALGVTAALAAVVALTVPRPRA